MKIAFDTYGDLYQWRKIYEMNKDKISDPNSLPKGLALKVEKPGNPPAIEHNGDKKYMIKKGQTLGTISTDIYGTPQKWKKLYDSNKQTIKNDGNLIFAGFFLYYTITPEEEREAEKLKQQGPSVNQQQLSDAAAPAAPPQPTAPVAVPAPPVVTSTAMAPPPADQGMAPPPVVEETPREPASDNVD
jgi:hypothetical protein